MEYIFGSLFANFLTDWAIINRPYKTILIKVSSVSLCMLVALLVIHYHNFPELTQNMIFADLSIGLITWLVLLAISFLSIKICQIFKEDLENSR